VRLQKQLRVAKGKTASAEDDRRELEVDNRTAKRTSGRRGILATPVQLAAAKARVVAAKAEAKRVTMELARVRREERRLRAETVRLGRGVEREKEFLDRVQLKENQRHRKIHRRLDTEALNKSMPPELQVALPAATIPRMYPRAELVLVSWWVCEWMKKHLDAAATELNGRAFVYRNSDTMSVDGRLLFPKPDDVEVGTLIAMVADALRAMACGLTAILGEREPGERRSSLYYHETFFQAAVGIYTQKHGFTSPGDRSRVLPGGIIETEFAGEWTAESADHALVVLEAIYDNLTAAAEERDEEFELGMLEVRFHWDLRHERPERSRAAPDRSQC